MFIAISAGGLSVLNLEDEPQSGLNTFPSAFLDGMSGRQVALQDPVDVVWRDEGWKMLAEDTAGSKEFRSHAVLIVYLRKPTDIPPQSLESYTPIVDWTQFFDKEHPFFDGCGLMFGAPIDLSRPEKIPANMGGLKFREGASQPVIQGSRATAKRGTTKNDMLAPGEFILGYEDLRGFVPPTIHVRDDRAARSCLPLASDPRPEPYPYFADPKREHMFDLGRNGSFLVIRQLKHKKTKVEGTQKDYFDIFVSEQAKRMKGRMRIDSSYASTVGASGTEAREVKSRSRASEMPTIQHLPVHQSQMIFSGSEDFLKNLISAKMMGRWPDGSSLVRHPVLSATALLRRRTFREMAHLFRFSRSKLYLANWLMEKEKQNTDSESVLESEASSDVERLDLQLDRVFDSLFWNDENWDTFVRLFQVETSPGTLPEGAKRLVGVFQDLTEHKSEIFAHPWLKPHDEWPNVSDNDFNFGRDDPQALACPIGSHVRRSNPRDTPNTDNSSQFELNNRHRILRRGRLYG